jgi:hypothetical protein
MGLPIEVREGERIRRLGDRRTKDQPRAHQIPSPDLIDSLPEIGERIALPPVEGEERPAEGPAVRIVDVLEERGRSAVGRDNRGVGRALVGLGSVAVQEPSQRAEAVLVEAGSWGR